MRFTQSDSLPFREEPSGAVRIGSSRVLLELVIQAFQDGATPEGIVQRYPTLSLPDTYAAVAYYLCHRQAVDEYLNEREAAAKDVRREIEAVQGDMSEIRSRLLARRSA